MNPTDAPRSFRPGASRLTLSLLLLLASVAGAADAPQELHLASDIWPPYTDLPGQSRIALDLVHEALDRAGTPAITSIVRFESVLAGLKDGTYDGSAALWRSDERESYLLYSEPYLENRLVLVGLKGTDVNATSLVELAGHRVGIVGAYAYGSALRSIDGLELVEGRNDQANLDRLRAGEVEYLLVDELLIHSVLEHQREEADRYLQVGTTTLARRTLHFAVRRDLPGAEAIIAGFNRQIRAMLADGTYNVILHLDWIRADVDGDGRLELVALEDRTGERPPSSTYDILLPTADTRPGQPDRFWIGGRAYDRWEDVPSHLKMPSTSLDRGPAQGTAVYQFSF